MQPIITVPKEKIGTVAFAAQDVLNDSALVAERKRMLQKALSLGNLYHHKVTITYRLHQGESQRVTTTVWAVTDHRVMLKGGRVIPVHAIERVDL